MVIEAPDVVYEQSADEKEVGIKLPIPDPKELPEGCVLLTIDEDHDDALNEIDITGTTLNFDSRDKTKSKIIEYSVFYDCQDKIPTPTPDPDEDPTPPAAPLINSPDAGTRNTPISEISGTKEQNTKIEVLNGGTHIGTIPTDSNDNWELDTSLGEGNYSFTAKATNSETITGPDSAAVDVIVDMTSPEAPIITKPESGSEYNSNNEGKISLKVAGIAEPDATVEVFDNSTSLGTDIAYEGGWRLLAVPFSVGIHDLTATAKDLAGNQGPASDPVKLIVCITGYFYDPTTKQCVTVT